MDVRMISAADAAACNAFHNRIYNKNRSLTQWEWEFGTQATNPFAVVDENGEILGTQALIPIRMIDESGEFLTAKSEETLLDPSTRGKDMFRKMYDQLFPVADSRGMRAIWGFTPAVKPFEKVGFAIPAQTSQLFFPLQPVALPLLLEQFSAMPKWKRFGLGRGFRLASVASAGLLATARPVVKGAVMETCSSATDAMADVCRRFITQWGGTTIMRDASFMQWRLFENPYVRPTVRCAYRNGQLQGWIAYSMDDQSMGYIVDLMVAPEDGTASAPAMVGMLLREAVIALQRAGAVGIRGWSVTGHPFDRLLVRVAKRLGFFHINRGEPMVLRLSNTAPSSLEEIDRWFITRIFTQGLVG